MEAPVNLRCVIKLGLDHSLNHCCSCPLTCMKIRQFLSVCSNSHTIWFVIAHMAFTTAPRPYKKRVTKSCGQVLPEPLLESLHGYSLYSLCTFWPFTGMAATQSQSTDWRVARRRLQLCCSGMLITVALVFLCWVPWLPQRVPCCSTELPALHGHWPVCEPGRE